MDLETARAQLHGDSQAAALAFLADQGEAADLKALLVLAKSASDKLRPVARRTASAIIRRTLLDPPPDMDREVLERLSQLLRSLDPALGDSISLDITSADVNDRFRALTLLNYLGDGPEVKAHLEALARDTDEKIRASAVASLMTMLRKDDLSIISRLLDDSDDRVVANTIEAIERLKDTRLLHLLLRFRAHKNNRVRGNVLKVLWQHSDADVYTDVERMIETRDNPLLRATACWVIRMCAGPDDTPYLALLSTCTEDPDRLVRENAYKALMTIGGDFATHVLRECSHTDEVEAMRKRTACAPHHTS